LAAVCGLAEELLLVASGTTLIALRAENLSEVARLDAKFPVRSTAVWSLRLHLTALHFSL
jgi:hypothetical protein